MRLDAYYYSFTPTGDAAIDRILSAVAWAGKAAHHTNQWDEEVEGWGESARRNDGIRGDTPIDWIQNAANDAARERRAKR